MLFTLSYELFTNAHPSPSLTKPHQSTPKPSPLSTITEVTSELPPYSFWIDAECRELELENWCKVLESNKDTNKNGEEKIIWNKKKKRMAREVKILMVG